MTRARRQSANSATRKKIPQVQGTPEIGTPVPGTPGGLPTRRRDWKRYRARSLREATEACLQYAVEKHQRSVDRVADLMGLPSKWALYKWVESGRMPAVLIRPFEHATGADFVSVFLASHAGRLVIDFAPGRLPDVADIHTVQQACTRAVGALISFAAARISADDAYAAVTEAIEQLAHQRVQIEHHDQPELF